MSELQVAGLESWYAVHCRPFKEWIAANALAEHLGLKVYFPQIRTRFRRQIRSAPFFPRYLFVRANLHAVTLNQINNTSGVVRLVAFGEIPQPVPEAVIEMLYQHVEQLNAQGGLPDHGFHPGDSVRLKSGPLQGLEGVFVGPMKPSERVRVLIDFLGHYREAEMHVDLLERTAEPPALKRERRTRGKGRPIKNYRLASGDVASSVDHDA